jgi:uncharacterized SAM-binding protein YcdF (DUF218 family)
MRLFVKVGLALAAVALMLLAFRHAGPVLVVNRPQRSDVILVLAGDNEDKRYWKAISLLRAGYAGQVLLDARIDTVSYGRTDAQMADDFVHRTTADLSGRVGVCPTTGDSTRLELLSASVCLDGANAVTVMLVTSDFHTRRALSIAQKCLPRYTWTAAATDEGLFSLRKWWTNRTVAKDVFMEWQKLAWWELVERYK